MSQSKFKVGTLLGSTALVALGVAFVSQEAVADDHARVVKSSRDQVSLRISGQFSREVSVVDDDFSTRVRHADSNYSSSRFRFHASGKINSNIRVNGLSEIAIDDSRNTINNSRTSANNARSGNDLQTRKTEIFITHNQFGRIWMGAGDPAANGIMNTQTHGIYSALPGFMGLIAANVQYRNEGLETLSGVTLGTAHADLDFNSRRTRLRYDTPVIAGFMASVSHSDGQEVEAALRYSGTLFDTRIRAGVGAAFNSLEGDTITEMYGAQASFRHSSGIGLTLGCAYQQNEALTSVNTTTIQDDDPQGCIIQGHFQRKFNELGTSSIVVEYDQKENMAASGDTSVGYGVTLHQAIDAAAMEVWFKYSNFELDRDGTDTDDVDVFTIGSRMRF